MYIVMSQVLTMLPALVRLKALQSTYFADVTVLTVARNMGICVSKHRIIRNVRVHLFDNISSVVLYGTVLVHFTLNTSRFKRNSSSSAGEFHLNFLSLHSMKCLHLRPDLYPRRCDYHRSISSTSLRSVCADSGGWRRCLSSRSRDWPRRRTERTPSRPPGGAAAA